MFTTALRHHLAIASHEHVEVRSFTWEECGNLHDARLKAAVDLAESIVRWRESEPDAMFSFVAHSHGGNVVLEAVAQRVVALHRHCTSAYRDALNT